LISALAKNTASGENGALPESAGKNKSQTSAENKK
jgi:hypothetical protein